MPYNSERLFLQIARVRHRFNHSALIRTLINISVVGLALAIAATLTRKIVGGYAPLYFLFLLPLIIYAAIATVRLHNRWISLSQTTTFLDRRLNLKARLITAIECVREPNPSKFSSALVVDVLYKLDDRSLQNILPVRVPKSLATVIPLAISLPLLFLLMPNLHQKEPFWAFKESSPQLMFSTPGFSRDTLAKEQSAPGGETAPTPGPQSASGEAAPEKKQEEQKKE